MKKKIAVIGFGFMGMVHAKNVLANAKLELCAIIDNKENIFDGIENTGNHGHLGLPVKNFKQIPVYKSLEECVGMETPDAVLICVPLFLHYELTRKALMFNLDVLLEKPFCPEPEQCGELIKLAKERNRILMVAHCVRFDSAWEFLAECIKDKRYGSLKMLSTCRSCGEPTWGVWRDEKVKKTSGGALYDLLIHDIDFVNSCLGVPLDLKINFTAGDYWEISLNYEKPAGISVKGGFLHCHTAFASEYVADFENASIRYSSLEPGKIRVGTDQEPVTVDLKGDAYINELEYFVKLSSVSQNAPGPVG
jgi:predicted dehydrogenase